MRSEQAAVAIVRGWERVSPDICASIDRIARAKQRLTLHVLRSMIRMITENRDDTVFRSMRRPIEILVAWWSSELMTMSRVKTSVLALRAIAKELLPLLDRGIAENIRDFVAEQIALIVGVVRDFGDPSRLEDSPPPPAEDDPRGGPASGRARRSVSVEQLASRPARNQSRREEAQDEAALGDSDGNTVVAPSRGRQHGSRDDPPPPPREAAAAQTGNPPMFDFTGGDPPDNDGETVVIPERAQQPHVPPAVVRYHPRAHHPGGHSAPDAGRGGGAGEGPGARRAAGFWTHTERIHGAVQDAAEDARKWGEGHVRDFVRKQGFPVGAAAELAPVPSLLAVPGARHGGIAAPAGFAALVAQAAAVSR
jgi:hypothetical protein